ncbi:zinc finger BED domain-containing protein RICESLEEPER 1-like isoform X2 [Cornus florida]|uniref:zinc finger BED domain-containing protein RICESLEEPER 1-like isoform X2 n=1 Tax=Cornus florida TaxID=4283 RepID=UPI002899FC6D|nr:zinc finger BED domain-containing protein RICESLEEPER 1-like isoform X2 [Cornus florida]
MVCQIRRILYKWVMDPSKVISEMASEMIEKLENYWSGCHMMLAIAVVLDPRYKMKVVEYFYQLIYGQDAETEIEKVRKFCYDLVHEYENRFEVQTPSNSDVTSLGPNSMVMGNDEPDSPHSIKFDLLVQRSLNKECEKSELDRYLDEMLIPRKPDFDVLMWWETDAIGYPILHKIARDIMAIPVSTVSSKSAFSTRDKVVSTQRSRLKPELLEALMCAKDWLWKDMAAERSCASEIDAGDESL